MQQRESTDKRAAAAKADSSRAVTLESAAVWGKAAKRPDAPAPAPEWTRYIDSRLKQFCTR